MEKQFVTVHQMSLNALEKIFSLQLLQLKDVIIFLSSLLYFMHQRYETSGMSMSFAKYSKTYRGTCLCARLKILMRIFCFFSIPV